MELPLFARQDPKNIRNKIKRSMVFHANKAKAAADKKAAREQQKQLEEAQGASAAPKAAARTLDNTREWDDTYVDKEDPELLADEADDEFADIFSSARTPKIMITTKVRPTGPIFLILKELIALFPNAHYYKRGRVGRGCMHARVSAVGWRVDWCCICHVTAPPAAPQAPTS